MTTVGRLGILKPTEARGSEVYNKTAYIVKMQRLYILYND